MTTPNSQHRHQFLWHVALLILLAPVSGHGQTAISGWTLSNSNVAGTSTAYSPTVTFDEQTNTVTSITVGSNVRTIASNADNVFVRRSGTAAGTGNTAGGANIWEVATTSTNLLGTNTGTKTIEDVLLGHNALMGVNDLFSNTGGSPSLVNNNIERVDYHWNSGFTAITDQGFAIFDRAASHNAADGFQIAVFTGWNSGTNAPTAYSGNVVEITAGAGSQYSSTGLDWDPTTAGNQSNFSYEILRFASGDNLAPLSAADALGSGQGVFGVYISFADLGIAQGTTVYGYSIMANDVTNVTANLVDWTNTANYVSTPDSTGSIDLLGVSGKRWVPEPSTYGAMFIGFSSLLLGFRRWRQGRLALSPAAA
jgi:hypothetical protein